MAVNLIDGLVSREVSFCRIYSKEAKAQLEKVFLKNRISYFVEWEERSFFSRVFGNKEKNYYTIKINEADVEKATELVRDMESIKIKKQSRDGESYN